MFVATGADTPASRERACGELALLPEPGADSLRECVAALDPPTSRPNSTRNLSLYAQISTVGARIIAHGAPRLRVEVLGKGSALEPATVTLGHVRAAAQDPAVERGPSENPARFTLRSWSRSCGANSDRRLQSSWNSKMDRARPTRREQHVATGVASTLGDVDPRGARHGRGDYLEDSPDKLDSGESAPRPMPRGR